MKHQLHGQEVEYGGEPCGFYKFNGILWDFIDLDAGMFIHGLDDISKPEAIQKVVKMRDSTAEQSNWHQTPKPVVTSSFIEVKNPVPIDEVRVKVQNTNVLMNRIIGVLTSAD